MAHASFDQTCPKITIGMTCYNAADTIARAVESALSQDWDHLEIIVVDDGSADGSRAILRGLSDSRVRVIEHERNMGFPSALNTILEHATGDYIAFFDDDDESVPDRLRAQYKRLRDYRATHPDIGANVPVFCYSHRNVVRVGQDRVDHIAPAIGALAPEPFGVMVADFLFWRIERPPYHWGNFGSCTLMAAREDLRALGGFDADFRRSAEWDLAVRAGFAGGHFIAVDRPLIIQYKTRGADKSVEIALRYSLALRHKHKTYLRARKGYRAAIFMAYALYFYCMRRTMRARLCVGLAIITAPHILAGPFIRRIGARLWN